MTRVRNIMIFENSMADLFAHNNIDFKYILKATGYHIMWQTNQERQGKHSFP